MAKYLDKDGLTYYDGKIKAVVNKKQDKLVSGQNIKTINGQSVLGSGDIPVGGGGGSAGVSSIGGKTGDIALGTGLTMNDDNTLNGTTYYRHMVQGKLTTHGQIYYIYMGVIMSESIELGAFGDISNYIQNSTDIIVASDPSGYGDNEPSYYEPFVSAVMIEGIIYFIGNNNLHISVDVVTGSIDFISDVVEGV